MTALTRGRVISLPTRGIDSEQAANRQRRATGHIAGEDLVSAAERARRIEAAAEATGAARLAAFEGRMDQLRAELREQLTVELGLEYAKQSMELAALRRRAVQQAQDDIVQLARLLAERILGEELSLRPERIVALAGQVLREAAGASRLTLHVAPSAVELLRDAIERLAPANAASLEIVADDSLGQGDLRVETDLGTIDARIGTQLAHLTSILVESIQS
jgi:flagellar assembly protein FliH